MSLHRRKKDQVNRGGAGAPDFSKLTYKMLQAIAKERGLKSVGISKAELLDSLTK